MNAHREIMDLKTDEIRFHAPKEFVGHRVEILVVQADDFANAPRKRPKVGTATSPKVSVADDAFAPLSSEDLRDWGL